MQIDLSFERNEVYECGAALLTAFANPKDIDGERSHQLFLSLCGSAVWLRHLLNPADETPIKVKPRYVLRDRKAIDRDVKYAANTQSTRCYGQSSSPDRECEAFGYPSSKSVMANPLAPVTPIYGR